MHLLVQTDEPNLGKGMQALHSPYARRFNEVGERTGHLFQGRYGAQLVRTDAQLFVTAAYVALNPVEAGLVRDAAAYRWSSHGALSGHQPPPWLASDLLLAIVSGMGGGDGAAAFNAFVDGR